jgi:hypothetical protein
LTAVCPGRSRLPSTLCGHRLFSHERLEVGQAFVELAANRLIHVKNRTEDAVDVRVWPGWSSLHQWNIFAESMLKGRFGWILLKNSEIGLPQKFDQMTF